MSRTRVIAHIVCAGHFFALAVVATLTLAGQVFGSGLGVYQIDWGDGAGGYTSQNSDWGRVDFALFPGDEVLMFPDGGGGVFGYLNMVTDTTAFNGVSNNWALQNVPLSFASTGELSGRLFEGYTFDLGTTPGVDVSSLQFRMSIESSPILSPAFMGPTFAAGTLGVGNINYVYGGMEDVTIPTAGGTTAPPAKAANTMGATIGQMIQSSTKIGIMEANVPKIDEEYEGCAPGSAARSIHYLAQKFPALATALGAETPQQTYDRLKTLMMTQVGKGKAGTAVPKFKTGKDAYNDTLTGKPIMTTQIGGAPADFNTAMMALANMKDVEAMIYWGTNAAGMSQGGHAAFISEIIKLKDTATGAITGYQLNIIDDRPQGDNMANNTKTALTFDAAGNLKGYGTGAKMIGFQIEMFMAVPEPSTVLMTVLGLGLVAGRLRGRRRAIV